MNKNTIFKILAGIAIGYCLILILAGPLILKPLLIKQTPTYIHGSLQLESFWINPFTHSVHLKNLSVRNQENHSLAEIESIYINVDILPLILLSAHIQDLELEQVKLFTGEASTNTLLHLPQLSVIEVDAALLNKTINIKDILLDDLSLNPILYKDKPGNIESFQKALQQLLPEQADKQKPTKASNDQKDQDISSNSNTEETVEAETQEEIQDWLLSLNNFQLANGNILLNDYRLSSEKDASSEKTLPVSTSITGIKINAQSIHSDFREDLFLSINMKALGGEIEATGNINPDSMTNGIDYSLADIQLGQLNPYIEHFSLASLPSGLLKSNGNVKTVKTSKLEKNATPQKQEGDQKSKDITISVNNTTRVENLVLEHQHFEEPLLTCQLIDSGKLDLDIDTNAELEQLTLDTFKLDQCQFILVLLKDGTSNVRLVKPEEQNQTKAEDEAQSRQQKPKAEQQAEQKPLPLTIGEIILSKHSIHIKDSSQGETVDTKISGLNASIRDIAEGPVDRTKIELNGTVNDHAPLSLEGTANFINPEISSNTKLLLKRLGLSSFSPYTLALSSRPIEKGVLSLDIETHIINNKLDSDNIISIEGIKMGKRESYQGAGNLPLALAITVLRDKDGNLNIDLPIQGDLDDPSFSIRKQVFQNLSNIINKAALAPLNMIGGLVGGDNTENRIIAFDQQSSELDEKSKKQAKDIAETLLKNPELALKLDAVLSEDEAKNLNEQQQKDLLLARVNNFREALLNSELGAEQIDITPADTENVKPKGGLEIQFFAR